jgi:hypothetical protein
MLTHPRFLYGLSYKSKGETTKGGGVEVRSLARSILGVKGCVEASRWGQTNQLLTRTCTNQITS